MEQPILYLAYYFPPLGGAGSQRSLKFVKYLPEFGIQTVVLAGLSGEDDRWAPLDEKLAHEIGREVVVRRESIYRRPLGGRAISVLREWLGMSSQFDSRWLGIVKSAGDELCEQHNPRMIFASMSPFASAAGSAALSKKHRIPWVADLRDPWALDDWKVFPTRWHRMFEKLKMERALKSASLIIMNTPDAVVRCREEFPRLRRVPMVSLTNGYDAQDFAEPANSPDNAKFTIVHAGATHTGAGLRQEAREFWYQLLGRLPDGVRLLPRSHYYLIKALEQWLRDEPAIRDRIQVDLVGELAYEDRQLVQESACADFVTFTGYVNHVESVRRTRQADLLFLPMHKLKKGNRSTIVPGKTYEYMASGRPILAAVPEGDARDFLLQAGTADICEPDDVDGILLSLKARFEDWSRQKNRCTADTTFTAEFERRNLTARLAAELTTVLEDATNRVETRQLVATQVARQS